MILYDPVDRESIGNLMTQRESAWQDIPTILKSIIKDFSLKTDKALEFGVEYGYSTSALANIFTHVTGVDTFTGDPHSGVKQDHYEMTKNYLKDWKNIELIKSSYQEFTQDRKEHFDLIHIDIIHDFENTYKCGEWSIQNSDVTIFHDTESYAEVKRSCEELAQNYNLYFYNYPKSYGLGILSKKPIQSPI